MKLSQFDFELSEELIALRPARPRDSARLLVVRGGEGTLEDHIIRDLPELLSPGDVLVTNDTRVIRASLHGSRPARGDGPPIDIEVNLNEQRAPDVWSCFARPARRLREGDVIHFPPGLTGRVIQRLESEIHLLFDRSGEELEAAIEAVGQMPIPPYIASRRAIDEKDADDYQTIFARKSGSVAAPTAGLHFTPRVLEMLARRGVDRTSVTLHVNAGTFLPVKSEDISQHQMHAEQAEISQSAADMINNARAAGGRCIAVGTTALRTLESAAQEGGRLDAYSASTSIFITPGYQFKTVDGLLTNFHLPRSTLFMLVSAMMGLDVMQRAYAHAIEQRYRFYSYGDACLLLPSDA